MLNRPLSRALPGMALVWTLAVFTGPQAFGQTPPTTQPAPAAVPDAGRPTAPLRNPLNRNPARRASAPEAAPLPPDPRDSTIRPVVPPGSDGRDTVLSPNGSLPPGAASTRPAPAPP